MRDDMDRELVAAAVVFSPRGVLIGKRVDGRPPWAFVGGEIESGETPTIAAVREVAEETGLAVEAIGHDIGRRVHPATGRLMVYVACRPTGDLGIGVCDQSLEEMRWVELVHLQEYLPGLFSPVLTYLQREAAASRPSGQTD